MSYGQLHVIAHDLEECLESIRRDDMMYSDDARIGRGIFMDFLSFCRDYSIIDHFDAEMVEAIFNGLTKGEDDE